MSKSKTRKKVAIVGLGRFGRVLYRLLAGGGFKLTLWDTDPAARRRLRLRPGDAVASRLADVFDNEVIFYAVPIGALEKTLQRHRRFLRPNQLIIDVLSVKVHPARVIRKIFGQRGPRAILTHPMFGPDSTESGFTGRTIVMNRFSADRKEYDLWQSFFRRRGLRVVEMSPEAHDRLAANSQGVTHFIGRLLEEFRFQPTPIDTLGAIKLHELRDQVCRDTKRLFLDLQNFNPYTQEMRIRLGRAYDRLYGKLLPKRTRPGLTVFGIQGGRGSFNEQAIMDYIGRQGIRRYAIKYLYTAEKVLRHLNQGRSDLGLFAMHNAVGGNVRESVVALSRYNCRIQTEFPILIRHFLMRRRDNPLSRPQLIMAHDQVFRQCQRTLAERYPDARLLTGKGDLADTARAAQALADGKLPKRTFILGPRILADLYDLEPVEADLQDNRENLTTFLLVSRR